jgi:flagellar motility protein MotE (MotC chaperone)
MSRPLRLGFAALAALVSVKLLSDVAGVDTLSEMMGLRSATAAETEGEAAPPPEPSPALSDPTALALPELLAAIAVEREALDARSAALDAREAEIELARATVQKQNAELTKLREDVAALLEQAKGTETADVARLVKIYEAMKPAEAATILQDADLELAVLVLAAMAERNAGPIMAAMKPDRANAVARILLERSRLPGDQAPVVVQLN